MHKPFTTCRNAPTHALRHLEHEDVYDMRVDPALSERPLLVPHPVPGSASASCGRRLCSGFCPCPLIAALSSRTGCSGGDSVHTNTPAFRLVAPVADPPIAAGSMSRVPVQPVPLFVVNHKGRHQMNKFLAKRFVCQGNKDV